MSSLSRNGHVLKIKVCQNDDIKKIPSLFIMTSKFVLILKIYCKNISKSRQILENI